MIVTKIVTAIVTDQALDLIIWETVEIAHHMQVNAHTTHIFFVYCSRYSFILVVSE